MGKTAAGWASQAGLGLGLGGGGQAGGEQGGEQPAWVVDSPVWLRRGPGGEAEGPEVGLRGQAARQGCAVTRGAQSPGMSWAVSLAAV